MYKYESRKEVPNKYKWDLTDYFKNEEEFNKCLKNTKKLVSALKNCKGCTKDGKSAFEYLIKETNAYSNVLDLYVYSYLINDENLGVKTSIDRLNQTKELMSELEKNTNFFETELLSLSKEKYNSLFSSCKELQEFQTDLDNIYRRKEHIIPEKEENIISELTSSMNNFSSISSNMLNKEHDYGTVTLKSGEKITITTNNYSHILETEKASTRKKAYNQFNKTLESYATTSASLLSSYVKGNNKLAQLHNFENAWSSKLFYLNMSDSVFKSLVSIVEENASSMTNYYKLKKKVLGLKKMYPYDLGLPLTKNKKEYSIEDAQELIKEALKPLGSDYLNKLNTIFDKHYIDYCGYKGKCSGGYSFGTLAKNSRILMSYNGTMDSVSTIAHECGHNVHHQFLSENNPLHHRDQTNIVCEVASLTNECLLSSYLSKNGESKEERLQGIENILRIMATNLFGAVREGRIEQKMYECINKGETITKEFLNELATDSLKKYYGGVIEYDDRIKNTWITRSHYYMNFYLYSYAISICVATKVAKEILNGNKSMLNKYIKFLSTGSDTWTIDTFKILDIDLENKEIYLSAIEYFNELINLYEKIYNNEEVNI